ncbi:hypothetical protein H072_3471 [Dactylellina haptotyla CBS 200.50]|uniref:Uncharacterized protein n=1 Tax=Dactylellina haptotyla (strain CBS 200.50) TaxID=1284197 RepID=S8AI25_DACHA|nr:hypothetical protein H072_3471 [Dactylellina haptotyla CBS 200.50]
MQIPNFQFSVDPIVSGSSQHRIIKLTIPPPDSRMQDPPLPRRDFLVPHNGLLDTSDDEAIFTPGPEYSSAATSMGTMTKKPMFQIPRPTTPKASIINGNRPAASLSNPPTLSTMDQREREMQRKRKREQTPIDDAAQLQLQAEHKDRDGKLLERQAKSPSPATPRPIIKKSSPKKNNVRFSTDIPRPPTPNTPTATKKRSSIDAAVQSELYQQEEDSDTLEEDKAVNSHLSPPKPKRRKETGSNFFPSITQTLFAAGAFACVGLLGLKMFPTDATESKLMALCNIPGMHGIAETLPFCAGIGSSKNRGPFNYAKGEKAPPDYKRLMELQFSFEKILEDSVGGSRLAYDMKTSEMAVRDLTTLVRVSGLACRDQLVVHLEKFGDNARVASRSLSKFSSRVMGTIDSILALDEWAKKTLEDIRDYEKSGPHLGISSLVMWKDHDRIRRDVSNTFLKTTEGMDGQLQRLVIEAQGVLRILDELEDRLNTIHEIISREANHIKIENDEVLSAILTKLGANKQKIARNKEHVKLLNNVGHYRKTALNHVSATVVELERMSADLEQLRETVAAPSLLDGVVEVPIELHIRNIDQGILRLTAGRLKASSRKEEYHQAVLAGIDYQNKLINAQIADIASKPLVHNVDI